MDCVFGGRPPEGRLLGVTPTGAEAPAIEGLEPLTTVWATPTGPTTLMTLRLVGLDLTWVAGVLSDELAEGRVAAGSVLTRFTSMEDFWERLGGLEARAGNGDR